MPEIWTCLRPRYRSASGSHDADGDIRRTRVWQEIAKLSSSRGLDGHSYGMYSHLVTDVVLFATVVVVPPLDPVIAHQIRKHSAQRFNAMFTPAVVQMVSDIAEQTSQDPSLRSFSTIRN